MGAKSVHSTITVANSNDAPLFTSSASTAATEDSAYAYSITTSDVDVGDTLTTTASTLPSSGCHGGVASILSMSA